MRDERESAASRTAFVTHSLSLVGSSREENCDCGLSEGVRLCDHIVTSWTVREALGFTMIGKAANREEALRIIDQQAPRVVVDRLRHPED
jgi:hypothetical protein